MFKPITSEVNIERGMLLKQIATGKLYRVNKRVEHDPTVSTDPIWEISNLENDQERLTLVYLDLVAKYFAQADE